MGSIVAIGGGSMKEGETLSLDQHAISLTGKPNPEILLLPTASGDSNGFIGRQKRYFKQLGCRSKALCLLTGGYSDAEIADMILCYDLIYAGGGNTAFMLDVWRQRGVDGYLRRAYEKGSVLCGVSAGAICWFSCGMTDTGADAENTGGFAWAEGLGLVNASFCPHYNQPGRGHFDAMCRQKPLCGVAMGDGAALVENGGRHYVLKQSESCQAFLFGPRGEKQPLANGQEILI